MNSIKIILTGATGMVGEGVLMECLENPNVSEILSISRKPSGKTHPKLKEYIISDFLSMDFNDETIKGYDACFFCAGVSSVGMNEEAYTRITYDTTIHFAGAVLNQNPEMIFNYVSGAHTDRTESGKVMWARVKGRTENALKKMNFKAVYNFRPGFMKPVEGQLNVKWFFKPFIWFFPVFLPSKSLTLHEVGRAMINAVQKGYPTSTLEIRDIKNLAI
ncbi:epimerase [Chryseobacterium indologenes]|uniref:NAD-dependent epimerase/dehydratase family protein n=1 Tax=Chryseobacterium indologenes TaxID=253 RepID=UPI000BFB681E|nr:NAD-dependent epimerase/dehydratase family protein [Chryseobacterium indologenes]ATN06209.1 epimerase [Chryseobacterium indologenes]AYY85030.1 NAD-dependent epimerase/dehydratase family protein [Chryseobacterium indologenes]QIX81913.1 NAD-dependent epimerase/dehydratase family protein [Chryseobacterium indologenes]UDQ55686.1 NAD-dependent epimerase/dehydratase family protein [Chryseobacterium indologenes]HAO29345.1 epimerase [Chryseobacterium indologenes]